jgi:hypothetical protein
VFLWNFRWISTDNMELYPRRWTLYNLHCQNLKSYKHKRVLFSSWIPLCSSSAFSSITAAHSIFSFQKSLERRKESIVGRPVCRLKDVLQQHEDVYCVELAQDKVQCSCDSNES